ncbi:rolling circle replication initiator protein [Cyclovirus ZM01]|uniref:Replication-associated protein n=1 Tax=Cyclovirus ZM01 TaxID=1506567 RepID=A0A097ZPF1_9CIRC|nr:rolling circle replication initiator protein [Cyclovirus ZM01]
MANNSTVRRFCWTLNNYTDDDVDVLQKDLAELCKFAIFGRETCPSTGTKHLQGFCNLQRPKRFNSIRKIFGGRAHIERAKGSDIENQEYCSKGGDVWQCGSPSAQGTRTDLQKVVSVIEGGETCLKTLAIQFPVAYIKYFKGIEQYIRIAHGNPERDFKTQVFYFWGCTGTGKSRKAREESRLHGETYYKPRGEWWDGYTGQPCVVIDDFYGWIKYDELLKICDRYPYRVPVKGGYENFVSKYIWITSERPLEEVYRFISYDCSSLRRRLNKEIHFE